MSACAGALNFFFRNSAWRRGLLLQRDAYLAGKDVKYPLYCPMCGVINCEHHNVRPEDQPFNFRQSVTDGAVNKNLFWMRLFGGAIFFYFINGLYTNPSEITGHSWDIFEWDDWEYYDDAAAEADPSKAKFVLPATAEA